MPIVAVVDRGPFTHILKPCGCRVPAEVACALADNPDHESGVTDGGVEFAELHAFRRDLLYAVRELEREDGAPPKGLQVKEYLETSYDEAINHSRLYQNLDALTERGLLEKGEQDGRTNEYTTTSEGRRLLSQHAQHRAHQAGLTEVDQP